MAYSNQRQFKGKIDGKSVDDFRRLDHSIDNLEERKEHLGDLMDDNHFFEEYFDSHYNPHVTTSGSLSEDDVVCTTLENMATYLLNSSDVIDEDKQNDNKYIIHKNKQRFLQKLKRESVTVSSNGQPVNLVDEENVVHFLVKDNNTKKLKKQHIKKSDINKDNETGRVLREYNDFLKYIDIHLKGIPDGRRYLFSRAKSQVKDDMVYVKNMLDGVWGFNINGQESTNPDYDIFDFTNEETIKEMIKMPEPDFETNIDLWITWHEFMMMVDKLKFSDDEKIVFHLLQNQWSMIDISRQTGIDYDRMKRTIMNDIVRKIKKVGNKYDANDSSIALKIKNILKDNLKSEELFG